MARQDEYPIHTLGFIGCGKLGRALLQGFLLAAPPLGLRQILVAVRTPSSAADIRSALPQSPAIPVTITADNLLATCCAADAVILACKPSQHTAILAAASSLAAALAGKPLISLLGGVTEQLLHQSLRKGQHLSATSDAAASLLPATIVVRAMPNVAAAVRRSTTLLASSAFDGADGGAGSGSGKAVRDLFVALGSVHVVPTSTLEAAAVVAASGPAFFAEVVGAVAGELRTLLGEQSSEEREAEEEGGDLALRLAAGAMAGAAALSVSRADGGGGWAPEEVAGKVASAGGSTEKGLVVLREKGLQRVIVEAMRVTFEAAKRLGATRVCDGAVVNGHLGEEDKAVLSGSLPPADGMMNAVVLKGKGQVAVQRMPVPALEGPGEALVKVEFSGLCGSDLHLYRGTEECGTDFSLGHEFTGRIVRAGKDVKTVSVGDRVVAAFTTSCGTCFYCRANLSSRCTSCMVFGTPNLGGAQSQYVRVPLADTTLTRAPVNIHPQNLILMADIFPTGFFAARNAFSRFSSLEIRTSTVAVIGCGPVGLCALAATTSAYQPAHLIAIDSVPSRLENAATLGAEAFNYETQHHELVSRIQTLTEGRGVDVVLELVGAKLALGMAFDIVRPGGVISSIGVHSTEFPFTATQAYDKNVTLHMGRCPVASVFPDSLKCLEEVQDKLGFLTETVVPLSDAVKYYDIFNRMGVQKVIFDAEK